MDLLVLGADGLDPRVTRYLIQKGRLETISTLTDTGEGELDGMASRRGFQSVPHTGPAWLTIYTGQTEREHGLTKGGWVQGDSVFTDYYDETVFEELVNAGRRVGVAFMANTYPAHIETDDGSWMISGYPSTGDRDRIVDPPSLVEYLPDDYESLQAKHLVNSGDDSRNAGGTIAPVEAWIAADRRKRREVLRPILEENPVDVLFYGTQITDIMGHRCKPFPYYTTGIGERIAGFINDLFGTTLQPPRLNSMAWNAEFRRAYEYIDSLLNWFIETCDPDRILLLSDHGYGLDGKDHAFVGTSMVCGDISRPECTIEVKDCILEALISDASGGGEKSVDDPLTGEERDEIEEQLGALGYTD
ncbi:alkaline phosphatase family protein [Haladaptatus sp. AB643]|uniref:alkaline phosphatase family protein n=1 Tax=Haladaptatus sp. AB643 TaxID=2934174 RepID=UPI00209C1058|nr:alkaline phosphatase family protein [Haladaptatus sp. AB643]MCO8244774.1 alkaline phosphatase family protein [Haladaptatus sp. AB643]